MIDRHPIQVSPLLPLEERVKHLEAKLAMLWDQVWWMQLPEAQRQDYMAQGFRQPIKNFYETG